MVLLLTGLAVTALGLVALPLAVVWPLVAWLVTTVVDGAAVFFITGPPLLAVVDGVAFGFAAALGSSARAGVPDWVTAGFAAGFAAVAADATGASRNKAHGRAHRFERVRVCMESMESIEN
jgi:hypothetical protein